MCVCLPVSYCVYVFQVNAGRHYTNLANRVVDMCQEMLCNLSHFHGGDTYSAELLAMLNLLDSSRKCKYNNHFAHWQKNNYSIMERKRRNIGIHVCMNCTYLQSHMRIGMVVFYSRYACTHEHILQSVPVNMPLFCCRHPAGLFH